MKYATTVLCFFDVMKIQVFKLKHSLILCTQYSQRQKGRKFSNMISNNATTLTEVLKKRYRKAEFCKLSHKQQSTDNTNHVSCYNHNPLQACKPHAPPEEPAKTDLPLLPGGATILCHFWNSVVLRQSRGLSAYALWRDISSCIGSRITHSCINEDRNVNCLTYKHQLAVISSGRGGKKDEEQHKKLKDLSKSSWNDCVECHQSCVCGCAWNGW